MSSGLDLAGFDTWLARRLIDQGLADPEQVHEALNASRREPGRTLARELERSGLLESAALERLLQDLSPSRTLAPPTARGAGLGRIGAYRLAEELGAGGMGVVYRAVHEETGAERALKLLPIDDPHSAQRFEREAQAMARVVHPNVVRVHSLGRAGKHLYLVLDLAAGGTLADRLRREGPLPAEEARRVVGALARGLAHVHAAGVLHRDLKPENVLFDERGIPQLTDFGLARLAWEGSLTESGALLGTPAYMAPEQVEGDPVDERTDVYGLGAVLYEALTGRPPFDGTSVLAVLAQAVEERPLAPRVLRPELPADLQAVCLRALEKRPAARFPSAEVFAAALAGEAPVRSGRPRWLAGLIGALATAAIAVVLHGSRPVEPARSSAAPAPRARPAPSRSAAPAPDAFQPPPWPIAGWNESGWFTAKDRVVIRGLREALKLRRNLVQVADRMRPYAQHRMPEALRYMGLASLLGTGTENNPGLGHQLLIAALRGGDCESAGYLALLRLESEFHPTDEMMLLNLRPWGRALGLRGDDLPLAAALARIATEGESSNQVHFARKLLAALEDRRVFPPDRLRDAWAEVQRALEPRALRVAEHDLQARMRAWAAEDARLQVHAELVTKLTPRRRAVADLRTHAGSPAQGLRRRGIHGLWVLHELGEDLATLRLAQLILARTPDLAEVPAELARSWLFLLAERRAPGAAKALFKARASGAGLAADPERAAAWLRLWAAHAKKPEGWYREALPAGAPPVATAPEAWRIVRGG